MKIFCETCKRETNHEVLKEEVTNWSDEENGIYGETRYQIVKCKGCDRVSYRTESFNSEDYNPNTGEPYYDISIYPRISQDNLPIKNISGLPVKVRRIYRETIDSFNNENFTLCGGGLRAIIEGICSVEGITDGPIEKKKKDGTISVIRRDNLQGKISGLFEKSLLTKQHAEVLHEHRFLGNESLHELDIPSKEELKLAIEIIEHTLFNIYELKDKAEELQWQRELRKRKK